MLENFNLIYSFIIKSQLFPEDKIKYYEADGLILIGDEAIIKAIDNEHFLLINNPLRDNNLKLETLFSQLAVKEIIS
jgi:hypothetical protein